MLNPTLVESVGGACHARHATLWKGNHLLHWPRLACLVAIVAAAGCVPKPQPVSPVVAADPTKADRWLAIASGEDQKRIERAGAAWSVGLAEARTAGFASEMKAEGELLDRGAALPRPAPTPGSYRCRLIKLGKRAKGPAYEKFKPFFCYIALDGDLFTIVKQTGSQRPAGRLWEDDLPTRLVFLGSLALGSEEEAMAYGDDPKRDIAGLFERVAPFRWRLVMPFPRDGAKLDLFELTPVADQPK